MAKIGKKSLGIVIAAVMSLTTLSGAVTSLNQVSIVQAASKTLTTVNAKLAHLNTSLHKNYLGIKNQAQWQAYINEIRSLVTKLPSNEKAQAQKITESVNKAESLVRALSRINQVEKSMDQNAKIIKNVKQWDIYLELADRDLARVDKNEFAKEITELTNRKAAAKGISDGIQTGYDEKAAVVEALLNTASTSNKEEDAKKAYDAALALPNCDDTEFYIYTGKILLAETGAIKLSADELAIEEALNKFDTIEENDVSIGDDKASTVESELKKVLGNNITIKATKIGEDTVTGYVIFDIVFSKGEAKGYTNTISFE